MQHKRLTGLLRP